MLYLNYTLVVVFMYVTKVHAQYVVRNIVKKKHIKNVA